MDRPAIAVDVGATNTRVALVSPQGEVLKKVTARTPVGDPDPMAIALDVIARIHAIADAGELAAVAGIGICTAGPVDLRSGAIVNPPNMPYSRVPLVRPLSEHFGLPVRLVNDARAGVLGEVRFGAGRGCRNVVYITISTGIGGGAYVNGRLLLGADGNAAEVGHLIVDTCYNLGCGCGLCGHWEGYASGRNLPAFFRAWCGGEGFAPAGMETARAIFDAARRDDPLALRFMEELGRINGRGVSNVIVAYNPEVIVLDGAVVQNNPDLIVPCLERHIDRYLRIPAIRVSPLRGEAPLLGAAVLAGTGGGEY